MTDEPTPANQSSANRPDPTTTPPPSVIALPEHTDPALPAVGEGTPSTTDTSEPPRWKRWAANWKRWVPTAVAVVAALGLAIGLLLSQLAVGDRDDEISALEAEQASLESDISGLESDVATLESRNDTLADQVRTCESSVLGMAVVVNQLLDVVSALTASDGSLIGDLASVIVAIDRMNAIDLEGAVDEASECMGVSAA